MSSKAASRRDFLVDLGRHTEPLDAGRRLWAEENVATPWPLPWQFQSASRAGWLTLGTR